MTDANYDINVMMLAKIVTKEQGIFFVRIHDGFKVLEIVKKTEYICDIEKIRYEHIEIIEPSENLLAGFAYDEVYCGTGDVLLCYKGGKIIGVDRVSD